MTTQLLNQEMIDLLASHFQVRREPQFALNAAVSQFLAIPGLVGFWPMSSVKLNGNARNLSGQDLTLTYNGNGTYNYYNNLVPYADLDGNGDFLTRPDEADLRILGTETIFAAAVRGLTLGGWFWVNALPVTPGTNYGLITKIGAPGQYSYGLYFVDSTSQARMLVSVDGTAVTLINTGNLTGGAWHFIVGRFIPSTSLSISADGVTTTNAVATPASIFNSTTALQIGQIFLATVLPGRASFCFLSANAINNTDILNLYNSTKTMFGVV
jgi:hypothetical protein